MRVVIDTNVFISALMFGGLPGTLLDLAFLQSFVLLTSPALLGELSEKLQLKFEVSAEDVAVIRVKLESVSEIIYPKKILHVIHDDPDDDRVLECALEGRAHYIVTGRPASSETRNLSSDANSHGAGILAEMKRNRITVFRNVGLRTALRPVRVLKQNARERAALRDQQSGCVSYLRRKRMACISGHLFST